VPKEQLLLSFDTKNGRAYLVVNASSLLGDVESRSRSTTPNSVLQIQETFPVQSRDVLVVRVFLRQLLLTGTFFLQGLLHSSHDFPEMEQVFEESFANDASLAEAGKF
jgi:hypothetical protein